MKTARIETILRKARSLIAAPENWTTCASYRKVDGVESYCASGAISAATGARTSRSNESRNLASRYAARDYLAGSIGGSWYGLTNWNDHPGRTHAEVLEAFDSAIGRLKP